MITHEELKRRAEKLHTHDWIMLATVMNHLMTVNMDVHNEIEAMQQRGRIKAYKEMLQDHPLFKENKK